MKTKKNNIKQAEYNKEERKRVEKLTTKNLHRMQYTKK